MKIVFMGTPEFAVKCLKKIIEMKNEVVAVFTQPDKLFGRNQILKCSEVKLFAAKFSLRVVQPESFDDEQINFLEQLKPDLIVVVAYGKILPERVLKIPKFGCVNIHASLLPRFRGASPIQASIVSGDEKTGVSAIFLTKRLDAGNIIGKIETRIGENETSKELSERLSDLSVDLIYKVLNDLECGTIKQEVQDESLATYAPVLTRESGRICFNKSARMVHKLICGLAGWPGAFCFLNDKILKIHESVVFESDLELKPGEIWNNKRRFVVGCEQGCVEFLQVQLEGRKKMPASSFLNGLNLNKFNFLN